MEPTTETAEYIEFEDETGTKYRIPKTNPPTMVVTYDMQARKGFTTWQQVAAEFEGL